MYIFMGGKAKAGIKKISFPKIGLGDKIDLGWKRDGEMASEMWW
jgi:hypothetical protein